MKNIRINVDSCVSQTRAEGPGLRYTVWTQGCPLRCPGCCNPHLLEDRDNTWLSVQELIADITATPGIEGITLVGGEPFHQADACAALAAGVRAAGLSVMVFSGFTLPQLRRRKAWSTFLSQIDLLIDGPYDQTQPDTTRRWIGSRNQQIHALTDRYRGLAGAWDRSRDTIELRLSGGQIQINGDPHADIIALAAASLERLS
jgi:anaerobic ribonucleoside-triphosphate reductase activating protein